MQNEKGFVFGKEKDFLLNRFTYIILWICLKNVQILLKLIVKELISHYLNAFYYFYCCFINRTSHNKL